MTGNQQETKVNTTVHTYIGNDTLEELVRFCEQLPEHQFTMVTDENTYSALGNQVESAFSNAGLAFTSIILHGKEVIADEKYLMQVFLKAPLISQIFLAVGSGTITDITRYVSYRTQNRFISIPTAPSVDGFISLGAPLIIGGLKDTYSTHAPLAVFADLNTLANAPKALIAAGFGDIIGKITALADWKLEYLIWGDPFDEAVERRVRNALEKCIASANGIASRSQDGIQNLMEALLESGMGMLEFGNSRPASGAEHHCSHYWEMKLLEENKPALLHGAKVGFATMLIAEQYEILRNMSRRDAIDCLEGAEYPSHAEQQAEIEHVYGNMSSEILTMQEPFLKLSTAELDVIKYRIIDNWTAIQAVLTTIPVAEDIQELLEIVDAPISVTGLGLESTKIQEALQYSHYLRRRFTIIKLLKILGVKDKSSRNLG